MKLKTGHSRKANIQDQTAFLLAKGEFKEVFRRLESQGMIADRSQEPFEGPSNGLVIIYYIDCEWFFSHPTLASAGKSPWAMNSNASQRKGPVRKDDVVKFMGNKKEKILDLGPIV